MGRSCSVCSLPTASAINTMLRSRSARDVAGEFGISYDALTRHARNHLTSAQVEQVADERPGANPDPLDELTAALRVRALAGNPADTREYRLALAAQMAAKHAAASDRALTDEPEWIALRTAVLRALEPFPDARRAVASALEGMD